jgi:hypothetical protein
MTYTITAERSGEWWALECTGMPGLFSQVQNLDHADAQIRDAIAYLTGDPTDGIEIDIQVVKP